MEAGLTIVVSTSSSRLAAAEQLGHTRQVLQSLHDFAPDARKILIVDALPSQASRITSPCSRSWVPAAIQLPLRLVGGCRASIGAVTLLRSAHRQVSSCELSRHCAHERR